MKLIFKEYLASLRERNELDVILPDLMSEMGMHVYSRPETGVRQFGVDLAAVGEDHDGKRKVFLLTVKPGNLTRAQWDSGIQALRPSLNEIIDSYIPNRIPTEYSDLPIVICTCLGGEIRQSVEPDLSNYEAKHRTDKIAFQRWDGDKIANLLLQSMFSESLFPEHAISHLRKAIALLDEPEASYSYFEEMLKAIISSSERDSKAVLRLVRQVNISCWALYAWSREVGNIESPYLCSELAMLQIWQLFSENEDASRSVVDSLDLAFRSIVTLHLEVGIELVEEKLFQYADVRDGLAAAVNSRYSLDVRLALFDMVGRIALNGIWFSFLQQRLAQTDDQFLELENRLQKHTNDLIRIINANQCLRAPVCDTHSIEIGLVSLFLRIRGRGDAIADWCRSVLETIIFCLQMKRHYPCIYSEYEDLANHPDESRESYFQAATAGSTLIPTLIVWIKLARRAEDLSGLVHMVNEVLPHCTFQFWVPDSISKDLYFSNRGPHGLAVIGVKLTSDCAEIFELLEREIEVSKEVFDGLNAVKASYWPLILSASRHYRTPLPIQFFGFRPGKGEKSRAQPP